MDAHIFDAAVLAGAAAAFLAGGLVKGVVGMGLPLVTVPVLATTVEPAVAVALMTVPVMSANVLQFWQERAHMRTALRLWPLMATMVPVTMAATSVLASVDPHIAAGALGAAVLLFCAAQVAPSPPRVSARVERWASPAVGVVAGLLGGVSNFFGPPLIMYLTALRLERDAFVGSIAALFVVSGLPLYGGLAVQGVLTPEVALLSAAGAVPVFVGVALGRPLRQRVSQRGFQRILLFVLLVMGLNLIRRALF